MSNQVWAVVASCCSRHRRMISSQKMMFTGKRINTKLAVRGRQTASLKERGWQIDSSELQEKKRRRRRQGTGRGMLDKRGVNGVVDQLQQGRTANERNQKSIKLELRMQLMSEYKSKSSSSSVGKHWHTTRLRVWPVFFWVHNRRKKRA